MNDTRKIITGNVITANLNKKKIHIITMYLQYLLLFPFEKQPSHLCLPWLLTNPHPPGFLSKGSPFENNKFVFCQ